MTEKERNERFREAWEGIEVPKPMRKSKKGSLDASTSAKVLANFERLLDIEHHPISVVLKQWFRYNEGCWCKVDRDTYKLQAWQAQPPDTASARRVRELLECMEAKHQLEEGRSLALCALRLDLEQPDKYYLINCKDRVVRLDIETNTVVDLLEHSSVYGFTVKLAGNYDPELLGKWEESDFYKKLVEVLPDPNDRKPWLHFFASALSIGTSFHCWMICVGAGLNGKSMMLKAIFDAFGADSCASLTIKQLCAEDNGKHLYQLANKLLNIAQEQHDEVVADSTVLKGIASQDVMQTAELYKPGYQMKPRCNLAFSTNNPIRFKNASHAEVRRTRLIHFGIDCSEVSNANDNIEGILAADASIVITKLISLLKEVRQLKELGRGGRISMAMLKQYNVQTDLIGEFIREAVEFGDQLITKTGDLHLAYRGLAKRFDRSYVEDESRFMTKLLLRKPGLRKVRLRQNGKLRYWYRGVGLTKLGRNLLTRGNML
jgi:phage/plasmid-associated DNA primase